MDPSPLRPHDIARIVRQNAWQIVLPALVLAPLALAYACLRPTNWEASQALIVRDEAGDRLTRPGRFAQADEMKTSQETILELARSRNVLTKALAEVGPPAAVVDEAAVYPSELDLEALQASVKVTPPKGAEFGKTEVFYLKVQDQNHDRAVALARAICVQLQDRFAALREVKAKSTIDELTKTVNLAETSLSEATRSLATLEGSVGSDLGELRMLNELPSADSDLRRTAIELDKELRAYRATQTENEEFLKLLRTAESDPGKLLASPSVLLKSQPSLGRLRDGLVDAQLRTGQALGTMSEGHPLAKSARAAEQAIQEQLHSEMSVAIRGVEADLRVNAHRIQSLEQQSAEIQSRLGRLANVRAEYSNLVSTTKHRSEALKAVEHVLAEARASQAAAHATSLINLIDVPDAGTRPLGPGRTTIVLAGFAAGLMIGLAFVLMTIGADSRPQVEHESPRREASPIPAESPNPVESYSPAIRQASVPADRVTGLTIKQALQRVSGHRI
jgi:polysaccharide biosynthesis transport protein